MPIQQGKVMRKDAKPWDRCPQHMLVATVIACPRCARILWEHVARIQRLGFVAEE